MVSNVVKVISNYATNALQDALDEYAKEGYTLVSVVMAKNRYQIDVMYLFFSKYEADVRVIK